MFSSYDLTVEMMCYTVLAPCHMYNIIVALKIDIVLCLVFPSPCNYLLFQYYIIGCSNFPVLVADVYLLCCAAV